MAMLIIPVMPNKEEAWRRFVQELQGSQEQDFRVWCHRLGLSVEQVWLNETPGGTAVVVNLNIDDSQAALDRLATMLAPFDRWLRQQILTLHGFDLMKIAQATNGSLTTLTSKDDHVRK
jgi:signal transduction protein with GAF and PtsI domain